MILKHFKLYSDKKDDNTEKFNTRITCTEVAFNMNFSKLRTDYIKGINLKIVSKVKEPNFRNLLGIIEYQFIYDYSDMINLNELEFKIATLNLLINKLKVVFDYFSLDYFNVEQTKKLFRDNNFNYDFIISKKRAPSRLYTSVFSVELNTYNTLFTLNLSCGDKTVILDTFLESTDPWSYKELSGATLKWVGSNLLLVGRGHQTIKKYTSSLIKKSFR